LPFRQRQQLRRIAFWPNASATHKDFSLFFNQIKRKIKKGSLFFNQIKIKKGFSLFFNQIKIKKRGEKQEAKRRSNKSYPT
jgi:hypothetical protein